MLPFVAYVWPAGLAREQWSLLVLAKEKVSMFYSNHLCLCLCAESHMYVDLSPAIMFFGKAFHSVLPSIC